MAWMRSKNMIMIDALLQLVSIMQRVSDDALDGVGVSFAQWRLLKEVGEHPGCDQQSLAVFLGQTEAGVSRQARMLQKAGYLQIEKDKKDARYRRLRLSRNGTHVVDVGSVIVKAVYKEVFKNVSDTESRQFYTLLRKMY